ncbi:Xaa-Pro aminopeptidase [Hydrogenovibrio sp. 3SP14C1]|uniref:Xaa-Pro aminopeptidase n=1 Tax=Hydrogenovibrio sp. 3SP14C1 TaxID=3038774 RepID=UPI002417D058|nr:Xaa-Pro aminopeptidase [Hydrogenovibrio sp. 3SP14C1]MDG4813339.1 Xaa-Pro aminopeptidase [Hydrogenovibrio sp. 3SP14C1]
MAVMTLFQERRNALFKKMPENSVAFIASGEEKIRNRDVEYEFRAESDFYYLTGFTEPDAVLMLIKCSGASKATQQSILFLRPKDEAQEIWQGRRLGVDKAPETLNIDQAWSIDDFEDQVADLIAGVDSLFFTFAQLSEWSDLASSWIQAQKAKARQGIQAPTQIHDLDSILHEMRVIKSKQEIEWMRQAAQISVKGHLAAMRSVASGKYEYQVQSDLENAFKQNGSPRVAFNTIVAGGDNACVLHYTENNARIQEQDLVLVDAGAEYACYAGDITSTFPANGQFSKPQAALYETVLAAQQAAINAIKPGVSYDAMHQASVRVLTQGLLDLDILQGDVDQLIEEEVYKRFFMHGTGHWLGMDVHDVGRYKQQGEWRTFQAGMVVTVEPGLYISKDCTDVDAQYRGIGIRIEDDVVVTETGHDVLTTGLPRSVAEIEQWMAQNRD